MRLVRFGVVVAAVMMLAASVSTTNPPPPQQWAPQPQQPAQQAPYAQPQPPPPDAPGAPMYGEQQQPPPGQQPLAIGGDAGGSTAGRWMSASSVSYTNAAMTSADFYLEVQVGGDGGFQGKWARYSCFAQAYGIWSCGKGPMEGVATGRLDAGGGGWIELERVGRTSLVWAAKSAREVVVELPRDWQEGVLFRATLKR